MTKFQKLVLFALWALLSRIGNKTPREWHVIRAIQSEIGEEIDEAGKS